jgi:hypothetical protein
LRASFALLQGEVPALAPLLDYFGLFFVVEARSLVARLVGDGSAWCYALDNLMKSVVCLCSVP